MVSGSFVDSNIFVKGSDWQCMVVELRMKVCGEIF